MQISEIVYEGELRTQAKHLRSGNQIVTDAPTDNNGKGEAFSPTDLLSTSLGCCMLTIMGMVAQRHQLNIDGTKVKIGKIMGTHPRRVIEIIVEITFPANSFTAKEKEMLENGAHTCPVAESLHPDLKQTVIFNY